MRNRTSPVELRFINQFSGQIIRFDKPWANSTSPITIRFEGDVVPELPIRAPSLGIDLGMTWHPPIRVDSQIQLFSYCEPRQREITTAWFFNNATDSINQFGWQYKPLTQQVYSAEYATKPLLTITNAWQWFVADNVELQYEINWLVPAQQQNQWLMNWHATPSLLATESAIYWAYGTTCINQICASYYYGHVRVTQPAIAWGPHTASWICSTRYRPPTGKVTIRFSEPWASSTRPLQLRFTASAKYCYFDDGGGLIDANPSLPSLDFKTPIEPQLRRYYLMQPTITCVRVSDNVPIVISNISINRSRGQWASSVSIDFSSRIDASRAENQLLKVGINGYEFFILVEQTSVSKVFGNETYRGTGRSRSAELATPYVLPISYTNATSRSFAGLLNDMLQFTGWTIALNGIVDFNVPAGAFSVGNKSPIDAVQEAVAQLGCMLLSDDATKALTVVPRWPTVPWLMDGVTPDLTVHDAVITSYSESKEIGTECNVVWLRGEQQGISAKVKRAGTAGNIAADDISAQLIVDNQAARTAGTNALADTGNKLNINMSLPIMADLPPATPGMLIGIREGVDVFKGTCDSVTINASVSDTGDIDVEQTITVVRHVA
ncbi:hypothetical protein [Shewanella frigidimarina]|uniref:hypothetical protein n=1 Tax=Shewanella frigidimarina TaxID=56812 RepID=UPI003D794381